MNDIAAEQLTILNRNRRHTVFIQTILRKRSPPDTEQIIAAAMFAIRIFFMHFLIRIFSFQEEKTLKPMIA